MFLAPLSKTKWLHVAGVISVSSIPFIDPQVCYKEDKSESFVDQCLHLESIMLSEIIQHTSLNIMGFFFPFCFVLFFPIRPWMGISLKTTAINVALPPHP